MLRVLPPTSTCLETNQVFSRFDVGGKTRNIRYSIRFAAMVQDKSHVFLLPVFPPNDGNSDDDDENE